MKLQRLSVTLCRGGRRFPGIPRDFRRNCASQPSVGGAVSSAGAAVGGGAAPEATLAPEPVSGRADVWATKHVESARHVTRASEFAPSLKYERL